MSQYPASPVELELPLRSREEWRAPKSSISAPSRAVSTALSSRYSGSSPRDLANPMGQFDSLVIPRDAPRSSVSVERLLPSEDGPAFSPAAFRPLRAPRRPSIAVSTAPKGRFIARKTQLRARKWLVSRQPSRGVSFPLTYSNASSDLRRACLTRLCCAFRFSQPLDALFRSRPFSLVSCCFRLWDLGSQRFPPSCSRHDFHRSLPFCLELRPPWLRHLFDPKISKTTYPRWVSLRDCSEEQSRRETR